MSYADDVGLTRVRLRLEHSERELAGRCEQVDQLQQTLDEVRVALGPYCPTDVAGRARVVCGDLAASRAEVARLSRLLESKP